MRIEEEANMDFKKITKLTERPKLFARGDSDFWDHPHISKNMLNAHLNSELKAASRSQEIINNSVRWLTDEIFSSKDKNILDLGCGPGLYSQRLAKLGYKVTGIDCSKRSIKYAKKKAEQKGLDIEYKYKDYLKMDYENEFDIVLLIYCDFGALTNQERTILLKKINKALKPGGKFIFDVFTVNNRNKNDLGKNWEVADSGFWDETPYIALTETFFYEEEDTYLDQIIVINEGEEISLYRIYEHFYKKSTITEVLDKFGFINHSFYSDITGKKYFRNSNTLAVITEKL